ncbi:cache domain-containing protein [Thaumasiovibrio subtropicus]|uniref:cache domain-containing protein n=1 Tax=Thaumasiovibrio subtropicus TaxID=1891207 RepID=UPI000B3626DA|nr:cache domain-containing protein [Thaumasiovibrio subtropicus]
MSLKLKLIVLTLLPLVLISLTVAWIAVHQISQLGEKEIATFEKNLLANREQALKDHLDLAFDSINHILTDPSLSDSEAQVAVKEVFNSLSYGEDGYFFVYDEQGKNLVHPIMPELIGQNLYDLQDERGNFLIQYLIEAAREGGGFHQYEWRKPSTGDVVTKLSYARWLDEWNWMIGTGLYIEDIHEQLDDIRTTVKSNIRTTFVTVCALLGVTVLVIIVVTLAINLHEHRLADSNLKALAHKTVMFQESEKKHLARELHDGINQLLISSKCHFELYQKQLDGELDHSAFEKGQHALVRAITDLRQISHSLRPSSLDDIGLAAAIKTLADDFSAHTELPVNLMLTDAPLPLSNDWVTTLYRVIQESMSNIQKHAQATQVELIVERFGELLQLIIRDNGRGFSLSQALDGDGIGLRNMRERIEFIGGEFEIVTEANYGTEITVTLELEKEAL